MMKQKQNMFILTKERQFACNMFTCSSDARAHEVYLGLAARLAKIIFLFQTIQEVHFCIFVFGIEPNL